MSPRMVLCTPFIHPFFISLLSPLPRDLDSLQHNSPYGSSILAFHNNKLTSSKKVDFVFIPIEITIYTAKCKYLTSIQGLPQTPHNAYVYQSD